MILCSICELQNAPSKPIHCDGLFYALFYALNIGYWVGRTPKPIWEILVCKVLGNPKEHLSLI